MTDTEALDFFRAFIAEPAASQVTVDSIGLTVWNDHGYDMLSAMLEGIERATGKFIIARKRHGSDFEPHDDTSGVYLSDSDLCDGGCCDMGFRWG